MHPPRWRWFLATSLVLGTAGGVRADVTLVSDGRPQALVVTAAGAPEAVHHAARELRDHVRKASGVELAIVPEAREPAEPPGRVYLGDCRSTRDVGIDTADLAPEAFRLCTRGTAVFIAGRDTAGDPLDQNVWAGTLFGVYELLEQSLGVRWLWPGELGAVVPRSDTIVVRETDRTATPSFVQRWIRTTQTWHANRPEEQVWLRRHRLGHSQALYASHAFRNWWRLYGQDHPEYFNLLPDGGRRPFGLEHEVSMCVAEPALWRQTVAQWLAKPELAPGVRPLIDCSENDGIALCRCAKCRAWDVPPLETLAGELTGPDGKVVLVEYQTPLSDRYARFWASVQRLASRFDPQATVIALAYATYVEAPRQTRLNDHVIVGLVPDLPMPPTDAHIAASRRNWQGWADTGARLFLRPNYFLQGYCMPYVFAQTFGAEFAFAARHGMIGTDFDSLTGMYATQGPNLYLLARMHVRPEADPAELLREYYGGFGSAAAEVQAYFGHWAALTAELAGKFPSWPAWPRSAHELYTGARFAEAQRLLEAARRAAGAEPEALARVAFLQQGLDHADLACRAARAIAENESDDARARRTEALRALGAMRQTIRDRYVANLAYCHWSESACGWDWALGGWQP